MCRNIKTLANFEPPATKDAGEGTICVGSGGLSTESGDAYMAVVAWGVARLARTQRRLRQWQEGRE